MTENKNNSGNGKTAGDRRPGSRRPMCCPPAPVGSAGWGVSPGADARVNHGLDPTTLPREQSPALPLRCVLDEDVLRHDLHNAAEAEGKIEEAFQSDAPQVSYQVTARAPRGLIDHPLAGNVQASPEALVGRRSWAHDPHGHTCPQRVGSGNGLEWRSGPPCGTPELAGALGAGGPFRKDLEQGCAC